MPAKAKKKSSTAPIAPSTPQPSARAEKIAMVHDKLGSMNPGNFAAVVGPSRAKLVADPKDGAYWAQRFAQYEAQGWLPAAAPPAPPESAPASGPVAKAPDAPPAPPSAPESGPRPIATPAAPPAPPESAPKAPAPPAAPPAPMTPDEIRAALAARGIDASSMSVPDVIATWVKVSAVKPPPAPDADPEPAPKGSVEVFVLGLSGIQPEQVKSVATMIGAEVVLDIRSQPPKSGKWSIAALGATLGFGYVVHQAGAPLAPAVATLSGGGKRILIIAKDAWAASVDNARVKLGDEPGIHVRHIVKPPDDELVEDGMDVDNWNVLSQAELVRSYVEGFYDFHKLWCFEPSVMAAVAACK